MKKLILNRLKERAPLYISGEELSADLKVSRTAVWKHIRSLKEEGYTIESQPRLGHKLVEVPDMLSPKEVEPFLETAFIGKKIIYYKEVDSTNEIAKNIAFDEDEGTIVLAERQLKGKGRIGRQWLSPEGVGIWVSIILKPTLRPVEASRITTLVALAIVKAIRETTGLAVGIKWPNDIVYNGKKIAGILTEMNAEMDKVNYLIVGIGINVNMEKEDFPPELHVKATGLKAELGRPVGRRDLLLKVLSNLEKEYKVLLKGNFNEIIEEVKRFSTSIGAQVKVSSLKDEWKGKVIDLDEDGALVLELEDGSLERVLSGDVSVRNADGSYCY